MSAPVSVSAWGEKARRGERKLPALRILVAGQYVAAVWREGGTWSARYHLGSPNSYRTAEAHGHETADAAVKAALRRGLARQLGARSASRVFWSEKARKLAGARKGQHDLSWRTASP